MRSLVLMLCVVAPLAADETFVKVPFARAVDELVFNEVKAGRLKPPHADRVRVRDGKVECAFGVPGSDKTEWKEIKDDGRYTVFTTMVFLDDAKYDSDGFYMLAKPVYDQISTKLIHKHKGTVVMNADDPKDAAVYDEDDKCWRYPRTLARVPEDHKWSKAPPPPPPGVAGVFTLDLVIAKYEAVLKKDAGKK